MIRTFILIAIVTYNIYAGEYACAKNSSALERKCSGISNESSEHARKSSRTSNESSEHARNGFWTSNGSSEHARKGYSNRKQFSEHARKDDSNPHFLVNGTPWYDERDSVVNAHGVGIIAEGDRFYMFGEAKTDSANVFGGFGCYSSADLVEWRFEGMALPVQVDGRLGPERIGERPKVVKCPATGEFVMIAHSDDRGYGDPCVVFATSPTVDGPYTFRGPLLFKGESIKRWDIGTFVDDDGSAYLLVHHGEIYRFSPDFYALDSCMARGVKDIGESPAMLKKDGTYYWLSSNTTSWERNDNKYSVAPSLAGPWTSCGLFAPQGSLTHNTQCSFVLPVGGADSSRFVYVGDRWSFPQQRSAATLVFLPIEAEGGRLRMERFVESWSPLTGEERKVDGRKRAVGWQSDVVGWSTEADGLELEVRVRKGGRIAVGGRTGSDGGYGLVLVKDRRGREVHRQVVDFYSKAESEGVRYVSPKLPRGRYRVVVEVMDARSNWRDKRGNVYGTSGNRIDVEWIGSME